MSNAGVPPSSAEPFIIGRYALFDELAAGGMATVHLGRLLGRIGFGRTVAVKRLHAHYTSDPDFVTMFMDEARIVARIRHPNVVSMVDVVESSRGLFLIMEYVHGETLSRLLRACRASKTMVSPKIAVSIMHGVLLGLHAAHETKGSNGELLDVVHRDVSPQNIIVGVDGVARVLDFGIAKAAGRAQVTREGQIKGKLAYMAPEQIRGSVDRRADVFAASVVLWEALAGRRLHEGMKDVDIVTRIVGGKFASPSEYVPNLPPELDAIVTRGLAADPRRRYETAREMALDLERRVGIMSPREIGEWVEAHAKETLADRSSKVAAMELVSADLAPSPSEHPPSSQMFVATPGAAMAAPSGHQAFSSGSYRPYESASGTPSPTEMPLSPPPRKDLAPTIALLSFFFVLALVGVILGGYRFVRPRNAAAPPSASAVIMPRAAPLVEAGATPQILDAAPPPPATGSGAIPRAMSPRPPLVPRLAPPPSSAPPKSCDPPYTFDENGHKHYKLECLNGD